jgi:transcriptional regulator with XRE-family HTH domain
MHTIVYGLKVCSSDTIVRIMNPLLQFGRRVQKLRKMRKLTQEDLAELADLHRNYISQIECGRRNVSLLNILKIGRALKVRPSKLIEELR